MKHYDTPIKDDLSTSIIFRDREGIIVYNIQKKIV